MYAELNSLPLKKDRLIRIMKFWLKILSMEENNPVKIVYNLLYQDATRINQINWISLVKDTLFSYGFGFIWLQQSVTNPCKFLSEFKQRVQDIFTQNVEDEISKVSEHRLYQHIYPSNCNEYLSILKDRFMRTAMSKFRLGSHCFMVERGRWRRPKLEYNDRTCDTCGIIEDEYHVTFECKKN